MRRTDALPPEVEMPLYVGLAVQARFGVRNVTLAQRGISLIEFLALPRTIA